MSQCRSRLAYHTGAVALLLLAMPTLASGEETFVTIQKVSGDQMLVTIDASGAGGGRGRGMRAGGALPAGRGRGRGSRVGTTTQNAIAVTVPASAKITSAMRERRTFEFRVLAELPGGLRHRTFGHMQNPLQARVVTSSGVITEVNVVTGVTDINQTSSVRAGQIVVAVRPKRPPMKRIP